MITVYAQSMVYAQGVTLSAEHRAALVAKADRFREITGQSGPTDMSVAVRDRNDALLGYLTYSL